MVETRRNLSWLVATLCAVSASMGADTRAAAQAVQQLPNGVTAAMVEEGRTIFHDTGLCSTCHGENGAGTPLAPNLGDGDWLNIDGSFDAVVELIGTGVPEPQQHMVPMAPRGGSQITDEQLRAVAAYVWTLCRAAAQDEGRPAESCGPDSGSEP